MKKCFSLFVAVWMLLSCHSEEVPGGKAVTAHVSEITVTSALLHGSVNLSEDEASVRFGIVYSRDSKPTAENGTAVEARERDTDNSFHCLATGLLMDEEYYYRAYIRDNGRYRYGEIRSFSTEDFPSGGEEAVDLGLSVKWRSCNLGAAGPFEYGGYYSWGETAPKEDYSGKTYAWVRGDEFTKYNQEDNKMDLDLSDDAARARLGGSWRMPTHAEFMELLGCTRTRTGRHGIEGFLFTGPSGRSIFLPAGGDRVGTNGDKGDGRGYYWSSSRPSSGAFYAWSLCLGSDYVNMRSDLGRYHGHSIRPVSE